MGAGLTGWFGAFNFHEKFTMRHALVVSEEMEITGFLLLEALGTILKKSVMQVKHDLF